MELTGTGVLPALLVGLVILIIAIKEDRCSS